MIGLDTNMPVRYIAQDDEKQTEQATVLIDSLLDKDLDSPR
jgi:predicted nucleic-acid-binding protein